jgi:hypothetical protein
VGKSKQPETACPPHVSVVFVVLFYRTEHIKFDPVLKGNSGLIKLIIIEK